MQTDQIRRARKRSRGGRPPLHRDRHTYKPRLELPLVRDMAEASARAFGDMPFSVYAELVISVAHSYDGPYLPDVPVLPIAVERSELQRRTAKITWVAVRPGAVGPAEPHTIRLDRVLADRINLRCEDLDLAYSDYLRVVLRIAHGHTPESLRAAGVQERLEFDEGVGPRQRAS